MKNFSARPRHAKTCHRDDHNWQELDFLVNVNAGTAMFRYRCRDCKRWMIENETFPDDPFRIYEPHEIPL